MKNAAFRRPIARIAVVLCCVLAILILWATWTYWITQSRTATIIDVSGTVLYHRDGRTDWETASPGMQIRAGDQLFTQAPDGVVRVVSEDGNIGFQLEVDTLATFTARWNAILKSGSGGLYLDHGTLLAETRHELPESKTGFIIETKAAKATIVGSRLIVQALKGIPATRVSALEGEIHVEAASDQAGIFRTNLQPVQEKELLLTATETVIVYLKQSEPVSREFDRSLGRVIDAKTQRGIEGVVVQVAGAPELFALTDKDGYFVISGDRIYSDVVIAGTTGEGSKDFVIQPFVSRLSERVVDAVSGEGIAGAAITPVEYPHLGTVTGPEGRFTIEGLPVGTHTLTVVVKGYLSQVVEATISRDGRTSIDSLHLFTMSMYEGARFLPIILKDFSQYP